MSRRLWGCMVCPSLLCQIRTLCLCLIFADVYIDLRERTWYECYFPSSNRWSVRVYYLDLEGYVASLYAFMEGMLGRSPAFGRVCLQQQLSGWFLDGFIQSIVWACISPLCEDVVGERSIVGPDWVWQIMIKYMKFDKTCWLLRVDRRAMQLLDGDLWSLQWEMRCSWRFNQRGIVCLGTKGKLSLMYIGPYVSVSHVGHISCSWWSLWSEYT